MQQSQRRLQGTLVRFQMRAKTFKSPSDSDSKSSNIPPNVHHDAFPTYAAIPIKCREWGEEIPLIAHREIPSLFGLNYNADLSRCGTTGSGGDSVLIVSNVLADSLAGSISGT
jgi:hypothetical protein